MNCFSDTYITGVRLQRNYICVQVKLAHDVLRGLIWLSDQPNIGAHQDIKAANILVNKDFIAKVTIQVLYTS